MVNITINGKQLKVDNQSTIFEAAKSCNIYIPHLCFLENVHQAGSCRLCVVEVEGMKNLQASCITKVAEGMVIYTNSKRVRQARKVLYELLLSDHPSDCLVCSRNNSCELQDLGHIIQIKESRFLGARSDESVDDSSYSIVKDNGKCILCRRCVTMCNDIQGVGVFNVQNRGFQSIIEGGMSLPLGEIGCSNCGQCINVCPVGALSEKDAIEDVWNALLDPDKVTIVQTAPAIRVAIGEEFGYEPGYDGTGKMVSSLKALGFDHVFDTNFAADLTIIEEGNELLMRLVNHFYHKGIITKKEAEATGFEILKEAPSLPMITSCSPGWIKYAEHAFPDQLNNISSCKSPHMMMGALLKTYYAKMINKRPEDIYVVSIMPCTAKKFEIKRPEMYLDNVATVDAVLTTRELAKMIKDAGIVFREIEEDSFENPLGLSSGAADIFGVTGGVMEAALRTVYEVVTGQEIPFKGLKVAPMKGLDRVKIVSLKIEGAKAPFKFLEGVPISVASTSGLMGAKTLMQEIKEGISPHTFIEIMGCPGGCISGGGQPRLTTDEIRNKRMMGLYKIDENKKIRKSHENPFITEIYEKFLEKPLGHTSHHLLHTVYVSRKN